MCGGFRIGHGSTGNFPKFGICASFCIFRFQYYLTLLLYSIVYFSQGEALDEVGSPSTDQTFNVEGVSINVGAARLAEWVLPMNRIMIARTLLFMEGKTLDEVSN